MKRSIPAEWIRALREGRMVQGSPSKYIAKVILGDEARHGEVHKRLLSAGAYRF